MASLPMDSMYNSRTASGSIQRLRTQLQRHALTVAGSSLGAAIVTIRRQEQRKTTCRQQSHRVQRQQRAYVLSSPAFMLRRYALIFGIIIVYAWYYVNRYSLTYAAPALASEGVLELSRIGALISLGQIMVGISKLGGSVVTADSSPKFALLMGLALSGLCNVLVSLVPAGGSTGTAALLPLAALWTLSGLCQGVGSPSCARIVDAWCSPQERGTYWAVWNTSNNLGGTLASLIVGFGVAMGGWRWGLRLAGLSGLAIAVLVFPLLRDQPRIRAAQPAYSGGAMLTGGTASDSRGESLMPPGDHEQGNAWTLFWHGVLFQPGVLRLAIANFFIYGMRAAILSWFAFFALRGGHLSTGSAAALLSSFEVGGLFGSVAGGVLSDFRTRSRPLCPIVGVRVQTCLLSIAFFLLPALVALCSTPPLTGPLTYSIALFATGFGIYVIQALTALCGMELVPRRAVGISQGFLGLTAYIGAAAAGMPLVWCIQNFGWAAWRASLLLGCGAVLFALSPLRQASSHEQIRYGKTKQYTTFEWPSARRRTI